MTYQIIAKALFSGFGVFGMIVAFISFMWWFLSQCYDNTKEERKANGTMYVLNLWKWAVITALLTLLVVNFRMVE